MKRQGFFNLTVLHFLLLSKSIRKIQPCFLNFSWSFKSTPLHPVIFLFLSLSIHCLIFIALSNFSSVCSFVLAGIPSQFGAFLMSACNAGDLGSIPGLGRSLGEWIGYPLQHSWTSDGKNTCPQCGIPGVGRSPGGGHGNPLQYSCLETPHGQEPGGATVHEVAKHRT